MGYSLLKVSKTSVENLNMIKLKLKTNNLYVNENFLILIESLQPLHLALKNEIERNNSIK